jgi:hypothetical protein
MEVFYAHFRWEEQPSSYTNEALEGLGIEMKNGAAK